MVLLAKENLCSICVLILCFNSHVQTVSASTDFSSQMDLLASGTEDLTL